MVAGIGNRCLKLLMFLANFLIFVIGGIIFGMSLWVTVDKDFAENIRKIASGTGAKIPSELIDTLAQYQASLWIFVAIGGLLMVVGFLGCCGAGFESVLMLTLFFIVVLILVVLQMFALFYMYTGREQFENALYETLDESSKSPETRKQLAPVQDFFTCCGATKETKQEYVDAKICKGNQREYDACYDVIKGIIQKEANKILIVGVILLFIEAFALLFSCILCRAFREHIPYHTYY